MIKYCIRLYLTKQCQLPHLYYHSSTDTKIVYKEVLQELAAEIFEFVECFMSLPKYPPCLILTDRVFDDGGDLADNIPVDGSDAFFVFLLP